MGVAGVSAHEFGATQKRGRKHEALVRAFGEAVEAAGLTPVTNVHPRDLVVVGGDQHWLVEAKTVGVNAEQVVREAIGQLFAYRHFYYRTQGEDDPLLLAIFTGAIGPAFEQLLESLGIEFLCRHPGGWSGSAAAASLVAPTGNVGR